MLITITVNTLLTFYTVVSYIIKFFLIKLHPRAFSHQAHLKHFLSNMKCCLMTVSGNMNKFHHRCISFNLCFRRKQMIWSVKHPLIHANNLVAHCLNWSCSKCRINTKWNLDFSENKCTQTTKNMQYESKLSF